METNETLAPSEPNSADTQWLLTLTRGPMADTSIPSREASAVTGPCEETRLDREKRERERIMQRHQKWKEMEIGNGKWERGRHLFLARVNELNAKLTAACAGA